MIEACDRCGAVAEVAYILEEAIIGISHPLCSLECLQEFTWKVRESREKLSKSKDASWGDMREKV